MPAKRKKTNKNKKNNKLRYIGYIICALVLIYIFISDFSGYHGKLLYIPLEILLILLILSEYLIYKINKSRGLDFIVLFINSVLLSYVLSIELILIPATIKTTSSFYLYKQIHAYLLEHQTIIIPVLLVLSGAFVIPSVRELYNKKKSFVYLVLLILGIMCLLFGIFYSRICDLIYSYILM